MNAGICLDSDQEERKTGMVRLLVVEDDNSILQGLCTSIPWEREGFTVAGSAADGELALAWMRKHPVDIVLTDIAMPIMDGLTLASQIQKEFPRTMVVLLTGYDTFAYAQQAVRLGVFDFLLKPVNTSKLLQCMHAAARELENRRNLAISYDMSLPLIRQQFFKDLFFGTASHEALAAQAKLLQLPRSAYRAVLCKPGCAETDALRQAGEALQEALSQYGFAYVWTHGTDILCVLEGQNAVPALEKGLKKLGALGYRECVVTAGEAVNRWEDISRSAQEAQKLMAYGVFCSDNTLITEGWVARRNANELLDLSDLEHRLCEAVAQHNLYACQSLLDRANSLPLPMAPWIALRLAFALCQGRGGVVDLNTISARLVAEQRLPKQLQILKELCRTLCESDIKEPADPLKDSILQYLREHFSDIDLGLSDVAQNVGLSTGYLSTVFRQKTGVMFSDYLLHLRMNEAGVLLRDTDEMTYAIAERVGFSNPQYFSVCFKKTFGQTPTEYRGMWQKIKA